MFHYVKYHIKLTNLHYYAPFEEVGGYIALHLSVGPSVGRYAVRRQTLSDQ